MFGNIRKRQAPKKHLYVERPAYIITETELGELEAELARLTARRSRYTEARYENCMEALSAAESELSRLQEELDETGECRMLCTPEAQDEIARLQQALAGLESAVRILDVMLREPAAEGLMSAEDYRSYVQGAWLGVDEAAEKARDALAGERQGRQPDPGEIAGLLVELSRWSRVAELNGDLHARIASALAEPRDETGYPAWSGLPNDPLVRFTSASWHCPVCDRRGDLHDERCFVLELVKVAQRRKDGNRRLVETNGRLRETAEAAEARLQQALADANEARRGIIAACIAVKGKLDAPYPDDNRWTPWQRFIEPALRRLDEALAGLDDAVKGKT